MIEGFKAFVRPFMALSGWLVLMSCGVVAFQNETIPPAWLITICLAPSITWFGLRFIQKQKA